VNAHSFVPEFGEILAGLGVKNGAELARALGVHTHLERGHEVVRLAAGHRQPVGELLLQARRIKQWQLDEALAQQKLVKKPFGQVLIDNQWIGPVELEVALEVQRHQDHPDKGASPLALGNVLRATGAITAAQLTHALELGRSSGSRLGEALVAAGYLVEAEVHHGLELQRKLVAAVLISSLVLALAGTVAPAQADDHMAALQVSAVVCPSAHIEASFQASSLTVTPADVARGYVDVPEASQFTVVTPKGGNYAVDFHAQSNLFRSVSVDGLGAPVTLGADGGTVSQAGAGLGGVASTLSYRFELDPGVQPGVYEWPLMLAVRAR